MSRPTANGWRDISLFVTGLGLIVYEAVIFEGSPRPQLLLLYTGMVGLPAFLRSDEKNAPTESREGQQ